jgi:hypothetical protein
VNQTDGKGKAGGAKDDPKKAKSGAKKTNPTDHISDRASTIRGN